MRVTSSYPVPDHLVLAGRPPKYPFRTMAVEESFPVEDDDLRSVRTAVWRQNRNGLRQFIVRQLNGKWRCWRTA